MARSSTITRTLAAAIVAAALTAPAAEARPLHYVASPNTEATAPASRTSGDDTPWGIIAAGVAGTGIAVGAGTALAGRTGACTRGTRVAA